MFDIPSHMEHALEQPKLSLYYFNECPYCQRVLKAIQELGIKVELHNIRENEKDKEELIRVGGKKQVPCLFIDGKPLYESMDIIGYLHSL